MMAPNLYLPAAIRVAATRFLHVPRRRCQALHSQVSRLKSAAYNGSNDGSVGTYGR